MPRHHTGSALMEKLLKKVSLFKISLNLNLINKLSFTILMFKLGKDMVGLAK